MLQGQPNDPTTQRAHQHTWQLNAEGEVLKRQDCVVTCTVCGHIYPSSVLPDGTPTSFMFGDERDDDQH